MQFSEVRCLEAQVDALRCLSRAFQSGFADYAQPFWSGLFGAYAAQAGVLAASIASSAADPSEKDRLRRLLYADISRYLSALRADPSASSQAYRLETTIREHFGGVAVSPIAQSGIAPPDGGRAREDVPDSCRAEIREIAGLARAILSDPPKAALSAGLLTDRAAQLSEDLLGFGPGAAALRGELYGIVRGVCLTLQESGSGAEIVRRLRAVLKKHFADMEA